MGAGSVAAGGGRGLAATGPSSPLCHRGDCGSLGPMKTLPPRTSQLLGAQHGLITLEQSRASDLDTAQVRALVRSGRWVLVAPAVYSVADHRETWVRALWLAHLHAGPDSVISHEAAGRLRKFEEVPAQIVSLTGTRNRRHGPAGVRWHRADDLLPEHYTYIDGLPVTTPLRTIFDLASVTHIASLRTLIAREITAGHLTVADLGAFLDTVRRRGKPGIAKLTRVLDELGPGRGLTNSELEQLLDDVIRRSGLPVPRPEYPLPGRGAVEGFVDRCWPEVRLIVEADGRRWHTRRGAMERDATRSLEAQAAGFDTTRLLWEHLSSDPENTARLLRAVYDDRHTRSTDQRR